MIDLSNYGLLEIFLISLVVVLGASEIGRRAGVRDQSRGGGNVSTLEGAILALLSLMIGFSFAIALGRFDDRRVAVVHEANAIGTTALRARLLPPAHRAEMLRLLREYVQIRLEFKIQGSTQAELSAAAARSSALQEEMWRQAKGMVAEDRGMVPTGLFIQSLNELIDNQGTRLAAARNRTPPIVFWALYGVATIASTFTGYAGGLGARRGRTPVYIVAALVCAVILLIEDLDRPTGGAIVADQRPMIEVAASLTSYSD